MAQKFGMTWWGEQWLHSLSNIDYSNRLPRGASYARNGAVLDIAVKNNVISAKVQGSRPTPYKVSITVPKFPQEKIDKLVNQIIDNPTLLVQLLNRELNPKIMDIAQNIGLQIFPKSWRDFDMQCSCPDMAVPCKHLAAVIYMFSHEIDNNPFLMFSVHGVDLMCELELRGITAATEKEISVPELQSFFKKGDYQEQNVEDYQFRRIDMSHLQPIGEPLANLLAKNPAFYPSGDFQQEYLQRISKIASSAKKMLAGKIVTANEDSSEMFLLKTDAIGFKVKENGAIDISIIPEGGVDKKRKYPNGIEFMHLVLSLPSDYIDEYDPTMATLQQYVLAALHLLEKGAVVPQIVKLGDEKYAVRWLPAMLDNEVKLLVESLQKITPPTMLTAKFGKEKAFKPVADSAIHILSRLLCFMFNMLSPNKENNKITSMFFLGIPQTFKGVGESEITGGIKSWLDRLFISSSQYKISLAVEENGNDFDIGVFIDFQGEPISLKEILSKKKYESNRIQILKELSLLSSFVNGLDDYINDRANNPIKLNLNMFSTFLMEIIPAIKLLGVKVLLPQSLREIIRPRISGKISIRQSDGKSYLRMDDLLNFEWRIAVGNEMLTEEEFTRLLGKANGLIRFKNNYIYVKEDEILRLQRQLATNPSLTRGQILQAALSEDLDRAKVEITDEVRNLIRQFTSMDEIPVPKSINATLRPYQERGFSWMYRNLKIGFGSVIADDMGLGKTLQVITLLQKVKDDGLLDKQKAIVVAPTGLITNWMSEINRFAPALTAFVYHGPQRSLRHFKADILLTTYGVLRSDINLLKKRKWQVMVIDEAQNIKNANTAQSKAVRSLPAATHIAMSGTPVENRLSEFWTIMDFANKGYLGTAKNFNQQFAIPIQNDGDAKIVELFRKITAPFMMRRLKTDKTIINDLPDKIERNEEIVLTDNQAALYEQVLADAMKKIEGVVTTDSKSLFKRQGLVLQMILYLKQICNHPALFLKNKNFAPDDSGKTMMLIDLLQSIVESNQKVLVFTQFKEMGDILVDIISQSLGERPLFLHGGCSVKSRNELVERFQNSRNDRIFILSLMAAGTGLNLTAASHVIHYDLWWNPAVEAQATDRAYRIGQHQNVIVHRFITKNSFEERIDAMIQQKKNLAEMTVTSGENWIGKLSNAELREIFERQ